MVLRPYPILTVLTLPALAFLIWLGVWQLDRRAWKADLIAEFEQSALAPPADLLEAACAGPVTAGRRVDLSSVSPGDGAVRVYGTGPEGAPGWRIFAPVALGACADGSVMLAETGFAPLDTARRGGDGRTARASTPAALRFETPAPRGPFTPPDAPAAGEFYAFDARAMARTLDLDPGAVNADWWLAADDGSVPAYLSQTPPERHAGYAVTWFLMALALVAVYLVFHVRAGRLRIER